MSWCAMAWKVPPRRRSPHSRWPLRAAARASMSSAARRVKVNSRILSGATPRSRSRATRAVRVRVLPVPAPATITRGSSPWTTADSCASSRFASHPVSAYMCSILASARTGREPPPGPSGQLLSCHQRRCLKDHAQVPITLLVASQDRYGDRARCAFVEGRPRTDRSARARGVFGSERQLGRHIASRDPGAAGSRCKGRSTGIHRSSRCRCEHPSRLGAHRGSRARPKPRCSSSGRRLADDHFRGRDARAGFSPLPGPDLPVRVERSAAAPWASDRSPCSARHLPRPRGGDHFRRDPATTADETRVQPCVLSDVMRRCHPRIPGNPWTVHCHRWIARRRPSHRLGGRSLGAQRGICLRPLGSHDRRAP